MRSLEKSGSHGRIKWYVLLIESPLSGDVEHRRHLKSCSLDVMINLQRSQFSENQRDLISWLLAFNDNENVPGGTQLKNIQEHLQTSYGIETIKYDGALGHAYYVNSIEALIAQVNSHHCSILICDDN